jgi:hypothetical protein
VISYVEAMIKISEDIMHVATYDAYKPGHVYTCGETDTTNNRLALTNNRLALLIAIV